MIVIYHDNNYNSPGPPHKISSCTRRTLPQSIRKVPSNSLAPFIVASLTRQVWPFSLLVMLNCRTCPDYVQEASSATASNIFQPIPPHLRSPWPAAKPSSTDESMATLFSLEGRLQVHSKARCLPMTPQLRGAWLTYVGRGACLQRVRLDEVLQRALFIHCAWRVVASSCSGLKQ